MLLMSRPLKKTVTDLDDALARLCRVKKWEKYIEMAGVSKKLYK